MPGRALVMGIVNVTPDSFSDGGDHATTEAAVAHGLALVADGADIVDVGGESTRPGALRPSVDEELARVVPVVAGLAERGVVVSVDTMRAAVAEAAVAAGASIVNDVSGGLADPAMLGAVARLGVRYVLMHWRAHSTEMDDLATYADVAADVVAELRSRIDAALAAGIAADRLIVDPGIGFAKTPDQNWTLLDRLDEIRALGYPVLLGVSRKKFLGELLAGPDGPRAPKQRDDASVALTALAARDGIWGVRTHTARAHRDAIDAAERLRDERGRRPSEPAPTHVRLTGIQARGGHGVFAWERAGTDFEVDVDCLIARPAGVADDLATTLDYAALASLVVARVEGEPRDLIETVAEDIAADILRSPSVRRVEVTVHKAIDLGVPTRDVAVRVVRTA